MNGGAVTSHKARIHLINRSIPTEDGTIPPRSLGLVIGRRLGGGMHEDLDITNHGRSAADHPRCPRGHGADVGAEHDVRVKYRDQCLEVPVAGGRQEGAHHLFLASEIGVRNRGRPFDPAAGTAGGQIPVSRAADQASGSR